MMNAFGICCTRKILPVFLADLNAVYHYQSINFQKNDQARLHSKWNIWLFTDQSAGKMLMKDLYIYSAVPGG